MGRTAHCPDGEGNGASGSSAAACTSRSAQRHAVDPVPAAGPPVGGIQRDGHFHLDTRPAREIPVAPEALIRAIHSAANTRRSSAVRTLEVRQAPWWKSPRTDAARHDESHQAMLQSGGWLSVPKRITSGAAPGRARNRPIAARRWGGSPAGDDPGGAEMIGRCNSCRYENVSP